MTTDTTAASQTGPAISDVNLRVLEHAPAMLELLTDILDSDDECIVFTALAGQNFPPDLLLLTERTRTLVTLIKGDTAPAPGSNGMSAGNGGPAFPLSRDVALVAGLQNAYGMTQRAYFAAKAMQGLLAADTDWTMGPADIAKEAVNQADALLKALEVSA